MEPNKYTSALVGYDFGFRGRPLVASLATPHGTAAALKAEAPQGRQLWHRAADANYEGEYDDQALFEHYARRRDGQRAARKAANRRKARRGWR